MPARPCREIVRGPQFWPTTDRPVLAQLRLCCFPAADSTEPSPRTKWNDPLLTSSQPRVDASFAGDHALEDERPSASLLPYFGMDTRIMLTELSEARDN